eukprot:NODE_5463_length_580_cov_0.914286.p3 GENE.NODE_5463_length_580_cov_0.914286~~NODE_5463_length_580_cov_0.914286.p3  ORF type:complete len:102 (+),score=3.40 NODE_5463_length_580_cov_0.914286:76-381(+)
MPPLALVDLLEVPLHLPNIRGLRHEFLECGAFLDFLFGRRTLTPILNAVFQFVLDDPLTRQIHVRAGPCFDFGESRVGTVWPKRDLQSSANPRSAKRNEST